jgi:hypothetical protein
MAGWVELLILVFVLIAAVLELRSVRRSLAEDKAKKAKEDSSFL